jgi:small nuclear ribonucleoprotein (snRNP)-like protein
MGLLTQQLENYKGKRIAVVVVDGARLRGKLTSFDDRTIILEDVTELVDNKWVRPLISRSLGNELTLPGTDLEHVVEDSDRKSQGVLVKVIIHTRHVVRIWPWELKAPPPKEPMESVNKV